jgi:hypothetical protein
MSILLKGIKNGLGQYTGIGELTPDEVAELTGNLKFKDGTEQTTAYDPTSVVAGVSTVFGRSGDVLAVAGDYTAALVNNVPSAPITSTNVQGAIDELGGMVTSLQGGLDFKGLLAFDDADPAAPPATGASHYYIFKTEGTRTVGDATGAQILIGDWLAYSRTTSKWVHLAYSARTTNAAGVDYDSTGNTIVTGTNVQSALTQVDTALVDADARLDALETATPPDAGVTTFNTRTGAVLPVAGDYTGAMVTNTPAGAITATTTQGAIDELDARITAIPSVADHINNPTGAHAATAISYAPTRAKLVATEVQGAIDEIALKAFPFFDTNGTSKPIQFI